MDRVRCRARALSALLLSLAGAIAVPATGLAQSRASAVSVVRDQSEPCLAFDGDGAPVECVDAGPLFTGIGRAAVAASGPPGMTLSASAAVETADGAPLLESVGAQALLHDVVTLDAPVATARVTFVTRVTGALFQRALPDATATLQVEVLGQGMVWNTDQSVDVTIPVTLDLAPGVPQDVTILAAARAAVSRPDALAAGGAAGVGVAEPVAIRLEGVRVTDAAGAPVERAVLVSALGHAYPILSDPPGGIAALGPATLWLGTDDQDAHAPPLDVRAEVSRNGVLLASGEARCLWQLAARPRRARELAIGLGRPSDPAIAPGDELALRVLGRIGTNADDTPCAAPRHGGLASDGLRLYYDAEARPARLALEVDGAPPAELFLRSDGARCRPGRASGPVDGLVLDPAPPADPRAKCVESGPLEFDGGNPWVELGTWSTTVP